MASQPGKCFVAYSEWSEKKKPHLSTCWDSSRIQHIINNDPSTPYSCLMVILSRVDHGHILLIHVAPMPTFPRQNRRSLRVWLWNTSKMIVFPAQKLLLSNLFNLSSLWHSRNPASPIVYGNPLPHELAAKPPAYHRLVQTAPDGRQTLYHAAHAKLILGWSFEESQKLIWELIDHCTQPKVLYQMSSLDVCQID